MKILGIGKKDNFKDTFIFEVSQDELEKLLGTYYSNKIPELNKSVSGLKPGDEINISLLHDMTNDLTIVSSKMMDTMKAFQKAQQTLLNFTEMLVNINEK